MTEPVDLEKLRTDIRAVKMDGQVMPVDIEYLLQESKRGAQSVSVPSGTLHAACNEIASLRTRVATLEAPPSDADLIAVLREWKNDGASMYDQLWSILTAFLAHRRKETP